MAVARARRDPGMNYWPGFVDALSTLVLGIIFLLTVFVVVQFYLTQEVTGKDTALSRLTSQIAQLTELLSMEKSGKLSLEEQLAQLRTSLAGAETERDRFKGLYDGVGLGASQAQGKVNELTGALDAEKKLTMRALAQVEVLNQQIAALRRQLAVIEVGARSSADKKDKDAQGQIQRLGQRLNIALAQRVQELQPIVPTSSAGCARFSATGSDVRIVGDRFVFQSEVFFDTGQAVLKPEGRAELDKLATALLELGTKIPAEIAWVLRVDGHTDVRAINSPQFKSNWDLSAARAISVVQYLISRGVPPQRLVAAGFGEFQPIDVEKTEEAFARNRRIELKLTER